MSSGDMNVQNLSRTVLRNVQIDAKKIRAEAEEKVNEIKQHAHQDREMEYQKIIDAARKDSSYIKNKNIASAEAEARMIWLIRRENLINQVFDKSLELLPQVADRSDYQEIVENLIREAIFQLNESEARIHLDKKADQLIDDVQIKRFSDESGVKIERGKILPDQIGIIATTLDEHRQFDNTLQARLHRQKSTMRMAIYKILMGEG